MRLCQIIEIDSHAVKRTGHEILDKHISLTDHIQQQAAVSCVFEIEADRFLTAIKPDEIGAHPLCISIIEAGEIAFRSFNLDHPRAGIGKFHRSIGRCHGLFHRNNENTFKIACHHHHHLLLML